MRKRVDDLTEQLQAAVGSTSTMPVEGEPGEGANLDAEMAVGGAPLTKKHCEMTDLMLIT